MSLIQPTISPIHNIQLRPGMFIGDTRDGTGLHTMLWAVVERSVRRHVAGLAQEIDVIIRDGGAAVVDDGCPPTSDEATTDLLTHADNGHRVNLTGGVDLVTVNALSENFICHTAEPRDTGYDLAEQRYVRGNFTTTWRCGWHTTHEHDRIDFLPDPQVFGEVGWDADAIRKRLREIGYLYPKLSLTMRDDRVFAARDTGIVGFLRDVAVEQLPAAPIVGTIDVGGVRGAFAVAWRTGNRARHAARPELLSPFIRSFVNGWETKDGGHHVQGFKDGAVGVVCRLVERMVPGTAIDDAALAAWLRINLIGAISIEHPEPHFHSPTRSVLHAPEVRKIVADAVRARVTSAFLAAPDVAKALIYQHTL